MQSNSPEIPTRNSAAPARTAVESAAEHVQIARRDFLKLFGYGAAGFVLSGVSTDQNGMPELFGSAEAGHRRSKSPYGQAFKFDQRLLYMNIGTTGSSPTRVVRHSFKDYQDIAQNPTAYFFGQQQMRNAIAPGFGCDPYELIMSFNTTDGLWRTVMGIPFEPGDEIITTNMEEDAGISSVNILRDRFGVVIKTVQIPTNDAYSDAEILDRFAAELTPSTKAILFSSPIYLTGTRLPEKDLCLWAADNGVISIVDGAHLTGMTTLNLHDMGCDFFAGSGHKWQCGPGQTGFLYIRNNNHPEDRIVTRPTSDLAPFGVPSDTVEMAIPGYSNSTALPQYYPTNTLIYGAAGILKDGARDPEHNIAAVLQLVGNGSRPSQNALTEVCEMWDNWGREAIEDYIVALAQYLRARIVDIWGEQSLSLAYTTPSMPPAGTGLTSFNPFSPGFDYNAELSVAESQQQRSDSSATVATLRDEHRIVIRNNSVPHTLRSDPMQNAAPDTFLSPLRISTHLFHSTADVDRVIRALQQVVPTP